MRLVARLAVLFVACVGLPWIAAAQPQLVADRRGQEPVGPREASGAVLWNHGGEAPVQADPAPAFFVDLLRERRFDVFRLERPPEGDTVAAATRALIGAARDLRARGYRRLVLAGHSAGGWIALTSVAASPGIADAVVALAPAVFGRVSVDPVRARRNRDDLMEIARAIQRTRVMVFLFEDDDYDPGERGPALIKALEQRRAVHVVVDRPAGWRGHGVGLSRAFARRFGSCITDFVEAAVEPPRGCDRQPLAELPFEFPVLDAVPAAANDNDAVDAFLGIWHGSLDNGDDVRLVIEGGTPDRMRAIFARGRSRPAASDRAFAVPQRGRLDPARGTLVFEPARGMQITAQRLDGTRIAVSIAYPGPLARLSGTLERLSRAEASARRAFSSP